MGVVDDIHSLLCGGKSAGVAGVMKPGKTSVQVIIGPKVQFVADAFSKLCE